MGYMTDGLTFNVLRQANLKRLPTFRNKLGELSHKNGIDSWSSNDWMTALIGEVGELANLLKKIRRGDYVQLEIQKELCHELADIQTYLDLLAASLNVDLGQATRDKFNIVSNRVKSPVFINESGSDWYLDQ